MRTITYCSGWFWGKKQFTKEWSKEQARKAHSTGKVYAVLLGDPQRPDCVLDVTINLNGGVMVTFLDKLLRPCSGYGFKRHSDQMFLKQAYERFFDADTDTIIRFQQYRFKPDGHATIEKTDVRTGIVDHAEKYGSVVECWEPIPEFGHWESIARIDRGSNWGKQSPQDIARVLSAREKFGR